jgi:hypothetical protein
MKRTSESRDSTPPVSAGPVVPLLSRTSVLVAVLVVLCLVPRVIFACRLSCLCDDGYSYLHVADALERGKLDQALEYLNLNVYPIALMCLHKLGLEWSIAGKAWGVLMGTLIALPLFDWLRRMFNRETAAAGVFLYAVHPKLIEYSAEPIRDATFWFFFVLAIDCLWRAFEERRAWQFFAAGSALALALHTRFEGWFLLAPLGVWGLAAWRRVPADRMRLAVGTGICLAMTPLFLLVMNLTLLAHYPTWEFGRLTPFTLVARLLERALPASATKANVAQTKSEPGGIQAPADQAPKTPTPATQSAAPAGVAEPPSTVGAAAELTPAKPPTAALVHKYLFEFVRTVGVPFLALSLIGFVSLLTTLRDFRVALLPAWSVVILVAIWIQLTHAGDMNGRYFLTLAFIDAGFTAAGFLAVIRWLQTAILPPTTRFNRLVGAALVPTCFLAVGSVQFLTTHHTGRLADAKLGLWVKAQCGPVKRAVADFQAIRPAYFAAGTVPAVVKYDEFFEKEFDRDPPDLLFVAPRSFTPQLLPHFLQRATDLGLVPLDQQAYSSQPSKYLIYVRAPQLVAGKAGADPATIAQAPASSGRN